ncbi:uncharacterized protein LOC130090470 isoform X2 [Rhinichthys klamathensis goyatoka]|uniref:uncharacterized protein LOC130090470 isoform X2 n=1 Tax=Rhinichthys klamathensis goyatoka TaxID=3034132 RepID=UPI0024B5CDCF|nr:uncharacterized protein LOC130090470 isoform X2 [Rhinichthys klamathensis goyatoka]
MYIRVICASCSCQLNAIENMGDYGVMSYLADADGNVIIGPGTPVPTCHSTKPSSRSIPTTPTPVTPTQTPTPANPNPQNKTTDTLTPENQTPNMPTPSTPPTQIPENQSPGTQTPENQTSDTPILQHPANLTSSISNTSTPQPFTPTPSEKSANISMDDKTITAMLKEAVEPIHHTDHDDVPVSTTAPETTSSSEPEPNPEETTAALETANED